MTFQLVCIEPKELTQYKAAMQEAFQKGFEDADVIYFTGGISFFLMDRLRKTGTDGLLKKELANGKLMIGESAGAIICAPSCLKYPKSFIGQFHSIT